MPDSKDVSRALRATVRPHLRAHGFRAFTGRTAWRHTPTRIDVINFQSFNDYLAARLGVTTYSFALNIGQWVRQVPASPAEIRHKAGLPMPLEWQCQLRRSLERRIEQPEVPRKDLWYVDPLLVYLPALLRDACAVIQSEALPWFERYADDAYLSRQLLEFPDPNPERTLLGGSLGSPARRALLRAISAPSAEGAV